MSGAAAVGAGAGAGAAGIGGSTAEPISLHVLITVVLFGALILAAGVALFFLWLSRRRANRHVLPDLTGEGVAIIHNVNAAAVSTCQEEGSPKKLQKVAWAAGVNGHMNGKGKGRVVSAASWSSNSSGSSSGYGYGLVARRHMSLPAGILRGLGRWRVSSMGTGMGMKGFGSRLSLISLGSTSKRDSSGGQQGKGTGSRHGHGHRRNPSWIDEDALHGPATSRSNLADGGGGGGGGTGKGKKDKAGRRESWHLPLGGLNRSPTLPMLRRSGSEGGGGFGLHWEEVQFGKDVMLMTGAGGGYPSSPDSFTHVVMEATSPSGAVTGGRSLPEPPKPVVVAGSGRDRQVSSAGVVSSSASTATVRLGHKYSNSEPPMRPKGNGNNGNNNGNGNGNGNGSNNTSPVRSLPRTPTRVRTRQPSTDSTLTEILRSTEKRLQEGYVSTAARLPRRSRTTAAALGKSQWYGTSRESLLDRSQYGGGGGSGSVIEPITTVHRSRSESKLPGQKRVAISTDFVGAHGHGHSRQESQTSTISSTSSIELSVINDFNSSLGDFHRTQPSDTEIQMLGFQSVRSSVSSALSTIQSEDEVAERESLRMASSPGPLSNPRTSLRLGINNNNNNKSSQTVQDQQMVPISAVDPFSNSPWSSSVAVPRPLTTHAYPPRNQKSPDLLRESLERSLRTSLLRAPVDQSTLLAEASRLPPLPAAPGGGKPHSFFRGDCPGCCKLGETKTIPVQTCVGGSIPGSEAVELPSPSRGVLVAPSANVGVRGPLGPRSLSSTVITTKTNVLNSIILPPPVAAPNFAGVTGNFGVDNRSPPPSPTHRPSSRASMSAPKIHRWSSVSSSVYSQDTIRDISLSTTSSVLPMSTNVNGNKTNSQANNSSNNPDSPTPAPLQTVFKGTRNSVDNTKPLPKFTGFIDTPKGTGKRVLSLDDSSENDQENIDHTGNTPPPSTTEFAIAATVAELRRMNSALSMATSVASSDACGASGGYASSDNRPNTPTTATTANTSARTSTSGVVKGHKKSKSSSGNSDTASARKAYLSLGGTTTPNSSSAAASPKRRSVSNAVTTTANRSGSPALRNQNRNTTITITATRDRGSSPISTATSVRVPGFVAALESATTSPAATSSGSPIKKKRRTVAGTVSRMSPSPGPGPASGLLGRKVSGAQQNKYRFEDSDNQDEVNEAQEGGKKEEQGSGNTNNSISRKSNNDNNQPRSNNTTPKKTEKSTAPGQRVSFKFPPAVQATNFTFQVIPASSPLSATSMSNPSTPVRNNNLNPNHNNNNLNPSNATNNKRHKRHNSSHDSTFLRVQSQLQWNDPLTVARVRDRENQNQSPRTPSPPKNTSLSLSGYSYSPSPPKTPTAATTTGDSKRIFPIMPLQTQTGVGIPPQQVPEEDISLLQIPMKSPRRQQQQFQRQYQFQQQLSDADADAGTGTGAGTGEMLGEQGATTPTKTSHAQQTHMQTQTPYTQKGPTQTPGTVGTGRRSLESLGLYDKDGFLISNSPVRWSPMRCR